MNNKGITLIEIIISIVLISIVLILLFSLLISVKDINYESKVNSTYLINKSLIIKKIEEDFDKADKIDIENCNNITELYSGYGSGTNYFPTGTEYNKNKCIKLNYTYEDESDPTLTTTSSAFLGIYYYKNKESYVISYVHGNSKSTRTLPEYEKIPKNLDMAWKYQLGELGQGFHNIYIPIIGSDGKDYSLNISYYRP